MTYVHTIPNHENPFKTAERVQSYAINRNVLLLLPVDSRIERLDPTMMGYHNNEATILHSFCTLLQTLLSLRNMAFGNKLENDFNLRIDMRNVKGIGLISRELFRSNIRGSLWNILYFVHTDVFMNVLNDFLLKQTTNGSVIHHQLRSIFDEHQKIVQADQTAFQWFFQPQLYENDKVIEQTLFDDFYIDVWIEIIMKLMHRYKQVMVHAIDKRNDSLYPMTESLVYSMDMIDYFHSNDFGQDVVQKLSLNIAWMMNMLRSINIYTILKEKMINPNIPRNAHLFIEESIIGFIHSMQDDNVYAFFSEVLKLLKLNELKS